MDTDLAPSLWTPEEQVEVWKRLLVWCDDHPDEATPRLIAMYQDRLAKAEAKAAEEKAQRMELARRARITHSFIEDYIAETNRVNAALYGVPAPKGE